MQQLPTQPTGLSSFNMAEAHKQVATLTQQLAFKEEEVQQTSATACVCMHSDIAAGFGLIMALKQEEGLHQSDGVFLNGSTLQQGMRRSAELCLGRMGCGGGGGVGV